jgi:hypothetical protein
MSKNEKRIVDEVENVEIQGTSERLNLEPTQNFDNLSDDEIITLEKRRKSSNILLVAPRPDICSGPESRPSPHRLAIWPFHI